ncbi:MAG TPA: RNA-guided pseudouridylation complex pseudouridine synthase subunit Cbf5, partial [Euryarchaeota archaeon]|nr:RNA-guided pseudouridylation complex pseudouridine synthase subunit Cbf5 [Euryarchaeota archaeon]
MKKERLNEDGLLIKAEAETDPSYGKKPEEREIEELIERGIVNLDKPRGPSSHEVVAWIKRIMQLRKAGHGGTLDPKVSGVLPVTLEKSTKISHVLLPSDKEYVCVMRLHGDVSEDKILSVIEEFVGVIYQRPPLKSAVRRRLRRRRIYYIEDVEIRGRDVLMRIGCEAGTYMRKLCVDIGDVLGVGAHMAELRRTKTGVFSEEDSVTLQDLVDAYFFWKEDGEEKFLREMIKPVEFAVSGLP